MGRYVFKTYLQGCICSAHLLVQTKLKTCFEGTFALKIRITFEKGSFTEYVVGDMSN